MNEQTIFLQTVQMHFSKNLIGMKKKALAKGKFSGSIAVT
jgi:hypothetical protein